MNWRRMPVMLFACAGVTLLGAMSVHAQTPSPVLLVLEKGTNTLTFVDPATLQVVGRAPSGPDPHEVVASADGKLAYISNYGSDGGDLNTISVVDIATEKALAPIDLGVLHSPHGLDFAGGKLYFTAGTNKAIGRYDPATQRVDWVLGIGQERTHMIDVSKDLDRIITSNPNSGTISIIELMGPPRGNFTPPPGAPPPPHNLWRITNIPTGRGVEGFDISPDGQELWAANTLDGTISIIDLASKKVIATFPNPVRRANRLKITRDGRYAIISGGSPPPGTSASPDDVDVAIMDVHARTVVKTLALNGGSEGILLQPDGTRAFVAVNQDNRVIAIDLATLAVTGQITGLKLPDGMAWAAKD